MVNSNYNITDEKIILHFLEEDTAMEREEMAAWINADQRNKKYFDDLQFVWQKTKIVALSETIDTDAAWQRFLTRTTQAPVRTMRRSWIWKAASIAIITGAIAIYFSMNSTVAAPEIISSADAPLVDTLGDGSIVTLNKTSTIVYTQGRQRSVELTGEAFFNVSPDNKKPFVISVNDVTVLVTGTSFNVKQRGGETEVIVETGVVRVSKGNSTVELKSREKVHIAAADTVLHKLVATDALHNYYRTREFVCDNTPLWKLVEILNEAYGTKIIIQNEAARSYPLTTTFYNEDIESILQVISQTFKLTIGRSGDIIDLK